MSPPEGMVHIVGAGPGEMSYLTLGAQQVLAEAEVVLYDALVQPQLLTLTATTCLCIQTGKRGQGPTIPQTEINRLLVHYCHQGKRVVRLKVVTPLCSGAQPLNWKR